MADEIPLRFKDLPVSKLSEGSPARYQLVTKKESLDGKDEADSRLTRWTLGEKYPTKPNKTILLVGETGTGKSTLINAMVNYVMGVEWEDKVWFEIVEVSENSPVERNTLEGNVYEIYGFEDRRVPYSLTIIDANGYGAREIPREIDKHCLAINQHLHDLFQPENKIQGIDTMALVLTESTNRISNQLEHAFNAVLSLFGKDIEKNIVALITHSNGMSAANALQAIDDAKIKLAKNEKKEPVHFLFQNVQNNTITDENQHSSRFYWGLTNKGMEGLCGFLVCAAPKISCIGIVQNALEFKRMLSIHRAGEIPHRFKDLPVSKLSEGPPARYQLLTKKESLDGKDEAESKLRRWTVGERDPTKPNKTILLVGETGVGKSTMINAIVNYVMGVQWEDKVWFEIVEEGGNKQTKSQTADVTVYEIFGFEGGKVPYSLTIIDTPGYGATEGCDHDVLISHQLCDLFRSNKGIHEIDTVGLVLKASENRLSDRLKYIFDSVVSLFGKDLENIIVALLTNSNGMSFPNALQALEDAKVKCAKTRNNRPVHFLFDNCQTDSITEQDVNLSQSSWKITKQGMDGLFSFLDKANSRKLKITVDVLPERIRLKAYIGNLHDRIELIEIKQTEIRQIQDALEKQIPIIQTKQRFMDETLEKSKLLRENKELMQKNHESIAEAVKKHKEMLETQKKEMETNRNFTIEVDEPYKDKYPIENWWDKKAVCCTVCEETCHYPGCTLAANPWWCEVMKGGKCTSCTEKCHYTEHVKVKWRYVNKTRKVKKTLENMKEKYEKNKKMIQETENELENTLQQKKEHEISKQEMTKEEQELSRITQLEMDCEMCKDEIRNSESILRNMSVEMKAHEADKARWVEEAYQQIVKLQEISLNTRSMSTYIYLDFLIDKMKETGDMEKIQTLEDIKRQGEEGQQDGIRYMADRLGKYVWGKCKAFPYVPANLKSKHK